jgi:hypothetical protein
MPPLNMKPNLTVDEAIDDFLSQKRIAIAGVSLEGEGKHGANMIYHRLKEHGYQVFAVDPDPWDPDGGTAYRTLTAIPDGVDAVVIATPPDRAAAVVSECWQMGITKVWIHDGFGEGSLTAEAHEACREAGIDCIAGGCPLMYGQTSDFAHRLGRLVLGATGKIPRSM